MEHYTADTPEDSRKKSKLKSSAESAEVSGEIGGETEEPSGFEIGADRIGVDPKHEKIEAQIKEKEATREALMKSWDAKFDAIKDMEEANARHMELITKLHLAGSFKKEDYEAEQASMQEKLEKAKAEADKDLDLAMEYREEIDKLKAELDEGTN